MGSVHDVVPARGEHAAFLAGLTTVILWGSAFVAIRAAGVMLSPGPIALGRLTVSSAILTAVALLRRERLPGRSAWLPTTVFGILFLAGCSLALVGCVLIGLATTRSGGSGGTGLVLLVVATLAYASAVVVQKVALARASAFQVTWL